MESSMDIPYLLQHTAAMMQRQSDQILQERLGIGISQLRILIILEQEPNVQQRKLADHLGQTESSISLQIKLMAEKGYLTVGVNPKSKREHLAVLTPKGLKITQAAGEVLNGYNQPLAKTMGDKRQKALQELLSLVHDYTCAPGKPFACDHSSKIEFEVKARGTYN